MAAPNTHIDELLNLYLDRELSHEQEEQLYSRLAEDAQLRARLKHMQMLRSETRNYLASLTPPAALTGSVFAGLGFSSSTASAAGEAAREAAETVAAGNAMGAGTAATSAGTAAGGAGASAGAGILAAMKTLWIPISAAIITATVTTVVVLSVMDSNEPAPVKTGTEQIQTGTQPPAQVLPPAESDKSDSEAQASAGIPVHSAETGSAQNAAAGSAVIPNQGSPANTGDATLNAARNATNATRTPRTSDATPPAIPVRQKPPTRAERPIPPALPGIDRRIVNEPVVPLAPAERTAVFLIPGETSETDAGDRMLLLLDTPPQTGFAVKLRGYVAQAYPNVAVGTRAKDDLERMLENASIGLYYRLSSNELLGVEIGQDAFAQRYNGFIRGMDREVVQNLLTPWATINYRYNFDGMFGQVLLRPYIGVGTGFTQQAWTLSRGATGLILAPNNGMEMMFGVEGMLMAYPFDGDWFSSKKLGFTYAIMVNF